MEFARDRVRGPTGAVIGPAHPREIRRVEETAQAWLDLIRDHDLVNTLGRISEDVLGAYYVNRVEVGIFWVAIGLFSAMYGVPANALTVGVLAHELAHAYTHLGLDFDAFDWPTHEFLSTDIAIIEGLAQFYAEVVCKNLEDRIPDALEAFRSLWAHQHEIYRTHRTWVEGKDRNSGEIVRVSLVECRRSGRTMGRREFAQTVEKRRREIAAFG